MRTLTEVRELLVVVGQRCRRAKVLAIKRDEEERHCGHLEGLEEDGRVPEQSLGGPDGVSVMEEGEGKSRYDYSPLGGWDTQDDKRFQAGSRSRALDQEAQVGLAAGAV